MGQALVLVSKHSLVSESTEELHSTYGGPTRRRALHPAAGTAARLLSKSKDLLERYAVLSDRIGCSEGLRWSEQGCEGDVKLLKSLMLKRDGHVKSQVQRLLGETKDQPKEVLQNDKATGEETRIWDDLDERTGEARSTIHDIEATTWGMAARQVKKGVKRLVKYLPEEE